MLQIENILLERLEELGYYTVVHICPLSEYISITIG